MLWTWWLEMVCVGLILGCIGAWTMNAARVFMKTLAVPIALVLTRFFFPLKGSPYYFAYLCLDLFLIASFGLLGDYLLGLKLGRHDRAGYRDDAVGH
jgi:hypothetical protein